MPSIPPAILSGMRSWFAPPVFEDESKTAVALLLDRMLFALMGLWIAAELILLVFGHTGPQANSLLAVVANLLLLGMREWLRRGHVRSVGIILPLFGWLAVTLQLYNMGTIFTSHIVEFFVILVIATLVHGPLLGLLFCLLSAGSVFALGLAENAGLLPPIAQRTTLYEVFTFLQNTIITFALVQIARHSMMHALSAARQELAQRREAESALRQFNTSLDQRIAERTQALEAVVERQKITEAALRDSEGLFRSMFEHSPFAYQSLDEHGRFSYVNANLCEMLGYQREELIGRPFNDVWTPETRHLFHDRFCSFKDQGVVTSDLMLVPKNGQTITVILQGRVQYDSQGSFMRTHCVLYNVTERQEMQARLQIQNQSLSALHKSTLAFLQHRDVKALFQSLVDHGTMLLDAPFGQLIALEGDRLVTQAYSANHDFLANASCGREQAHLTWQAVDTLEPAVLEDYSTWEQRRPIYERTKMHAVVQLPIVSGDGQHCLGVLGLGRDKPGYAFTPDQIQVGKLFAQIAALAIENARLHSTLTEQSIRDPLTGLHNRRFLFETLQREFARSNREQYPITFMLLDIDLFKRINDFHGHGAGDTALCALAERLNSIVRASDILCRYGGDEHIIVMYSTTHETALARAEQIRKAVEQSQTVYLGEPLRLTVSIGVAVYPEHGSTADQVISCADKALYESKYGGRNRVTLYDPNLHADLPPARGSEPGD